MDKATQAKFIAMARQYHSQTEPHNFEVRNAMFVEMLPWISRWVASYLKSKGTYIEKQEMLSLSWDAFVFALKGYKNFDIPLPFHFNKFLRFYLSRGKKPTQEICVDFQSNYLDEDDPQNGDEHIRLESINLDSLVSNIGAIDNIKRFHSYLDKDYKVIFEDALSSLHNNRRARTHRQVESRVAYDRYCEAKKVMKQVVHFLLNE
jgi:hypothetical protein